MKELHPKGENRTARDTPIELEDTDNSKVMTSGTTEESNKREASDYVAKQPPSIDPVASKVKDSRYDFGPQYSVNVQVSNKTKGNRRPSTKVYIQVLPFMNHFDHKSDKEQTLNSSDILPNSEDQAVDSTVITLEDELKVKSLHPRAYHRGIAGDEPRNKTTGFLYTDVGITDTNHSWDVLPSDCIIPIQIKFPLVDDDDMRTKKSGRARSIFERNTSKSELDAKDEEIPMFCDVKQWNLSNPATPTPLVYASEIAAQFGMSFSRTLDLARSIQHQIDEFMRDYVIYNVPISARDPYEIMRNKNGLQPVKYKYGVRLHGGHCAVDVSTKHKLFDDVERCTRTVQEAAEESVSLLRGDRTDRRKRENKDILRSKKKQFKNNIRSVEIRKHDIKSFDVDSKYSLVFFRRAEEENRKVIKRLIDEGNQLGVTYGKMNCHYCRNPKDDCIRFPCGLISHNLCGSHLYVSNCSRIF